MQPLMRREVAGATAHIAHTTKADGDLSPSTVDAPRLADRRRAVVDHPWWAVHQIHSDRVITVPSSRATPRRVPADGLVTDEVGVVVAVHSGDCVPVGFVSDDGVVGVAHAGWKGLEAGVLESTVRLIRSIATTPKVVAVVGPHIRVDRYEFGADDLRRLARRFGGDVVGRTADDRPALDLTVAIGSELSRLGITVEAWSSDCTARDDHRYWSHRERGERGRIALVAWLEKSP